MQTPLINAAAEEFNLWLSSHTDRAEAAADALDALDLSTLPPSQIAALTDLANLLAKALGRD
jgi:HAMP domain-containing protein